MFNISFTATRGIQAKKTYYVTSCKFKNIPLLFPRFPDGSTPANERAQRVLNKSRVPKIKKYILENPDSFVFSAVAVSASDMPEFRVISGDIGELTFSDDTEFSINDGQHRIAAIIEALKENNRLAHETIPMVIFIDQGLQRSQQIFTDLNRHTVKPTPSINILFDSRDQMAEVSRYIADNIPYMKSMVEFEKTCISNRSKELFTLSGIYNASKIYIGRTSTSTDVTADERETLIKFWNLIGDCIDIWYEAKTGKLSSADLRRDYIHAHSLFLNVIATVARDLERSGHDLASLLPMIKEIDWRRSNPDWNGRALNNSKLSKSGINMSLTINYVKQRLGLSLSDYELSIENNFNSSRANI
jgi:DNA sulfur modification protein DndB